MDSPSGFSRWWKLLPALAVVAGGLAWGRLAWVALNNVSPPHPLTIEGVDRDHEAAWLRCHPRDPVIDGAGLWAIWQCGIGPEGRAHLVRLDLDALQVQRRWSLPAPYTEALRLQLWGLIVEGDDRLLLLEHTEPDSGRIPERTMMVLRLHPGGGLELLARLPHEAESPYGLLAWARGADGFEFVYEDGRICSLSQGEDFGCEALMPEVQGDRRRLNLKAAWRDGAGAWWAVWKKTHNFDGPHELVLLGPGRVQALEGVAAKGQQRLDRLAGNMLHRGGSWEVREGRLVQPQPPAHSGWGGLQLDGSGTPLILDGALTRQRRWRGEEHQRLVRLGDEMFRMDMGFSGLRFGRDLDRPGPLVAHEDLTAIIATFPVRHADRFWILHHSSLSAVVMDADLHPQPMGLGQRFGRLLPSSEGDRERLMSGVGPNIMSFREGQDIGLQLLSQFFPILFMPLCPLLVLFALIVFRRRRAGLMGANLLAGVYLMSWPLLGHDYWLITSWF